MTYPALKALHLIFVVSWFAGLFYIFRLFVYHIQNWDEPRTRHVLGTMERRLLSYIMLPAAVGTVFLGVSLIYQNAGLLYAGWLWIKLLFVGLLLAYHGAAWWTHLEMSRGRRPLSERSCRIINEVPTVALIAISLLAFLKPF